MAKSTRTPSTLLNTTARLHLVHDPEQNARIVRRRSGEWHQNGWFQTEPAQLAPDDLTAETTYGRGVDRLGERTLCTAGWDFNRIRHPAAEHPETVRAAHERAVVDWAAGERGRIAVDGLQARLLPVDRHDFHRTLRHPNQWLRQRC